MSRERQEARAYLLPSGMSPWNWVDDGAVLAWRDGTTVVFREELIQVLETFGDRQLPAFGAMVLLLAAGVAAMHYFVWIGAAPLVPLTSCMAAPLALPTHTPTV